MERTSTEHAKARLTGQAREKGGWPHAEGKIAGVHDATGTADTHPLVPQLSALHSFRIQLDVAVVVMVLVLTNLIAHFTTPWASIATVPSQLVARNGVHANSTIVRVSG